MPRERRTVPDPYVYDVKYREDTRGIVACFLRYAGVSERGRARGEARARTHDSPNDQSTKQGPSLHSGMHTQPRIDASPSSRKIEGREGGGRAPCQFELKAYAPSAAGRLFLETRVPTTAMLLYSLPIKNQRAIT